jgi:tRNA pseudouridine38-40 synthase
MNVFAMYTYRMTIEYDGTDWSGWQIQPDQPTVQSAIEEALETVLRTRPNVVGSGRTDAGVHATGQVAHFEMEREIDAHRICGSLNGLLPATIGVRELVPARAGFHARYDARARRYRYRITTVPRPLERAFRVFVRPTPDMKAMNRAASDLLGTRDFDTFCRTASATENRVCTVTHAAWQFAAPDAMDFVIEANRFLHGMVRAIVGTLLDVGRGRRREDSIPDLLGARDRRVAGPAAPAAGLTLEAVTYAPEEI